MGCDGPGKLKPSLLPRPNNGLVERYSLQQELIIPYSSEQNGMAKRVVRTLKAQCRHRHRFETPQHANRVLLADWIG